MIAALYRTDGRREYLVRSIESFEEHVVGPITRRIIHDDSGEDPSWLFQTFPGWEIVCTNGRSGFAGAIQSAWRYLEDADEQFVFDCEDDFTFNGLVNLYALADLLTAQAHLAQISLVRQRWGNEPEGGFMAQAPQWYTQRKEDQYEWVETRRNWTTNPSLYRQEVVHIGWPDAPDSEGYFGFALKEDIGLPWGITPDKVQFGLWGAIGDPPSIEHIGLERIGVGY